MSGCWKKALGSEAKIKSSCAVGDHYRLYICQIVGVTVENRFLEKDLETPLHYGILNIDPLFEAAIAAKENLPPRLYFGNIDREKITRTPDNIGSSKKWIGSFDDWIEDEFKRGKLNNLEKEKILDLTKTWQKNPDPVANKEIKEKLTNYLIQIIWR